MSFRAELEATAVRAGLQLGERVLGACERHFELLVTWNRTHNLTRIVDAADAVKLHYLDCLMPLLAQHGPRSFVDVGSGAGFPGLLAALAWPEAEATLVEPARKRASFLVLAAAAMGLERVRVVGPQDGATGARVLSRATFSPGSRVSLRGYAAEGGEIGVWAHPHDAATWESELSTWQWRPLPGLDYQVPGVEARCLLRGRAAGSV